MKKEKVNRKAFVVLGEGLLVRKMTREDVGLSVFIAEEDIKKGDILALHGTGPVYVSP